MEISNNTLVGILGLLCAEQNVGNLNNCTFRNSGTPVRRAKRRKSKQIQFQEFWDSCAQNKTSEISKMHFHKFWHSGAQRGAAFGRPTLGGFLCIGSEQSTCPSSHHTAPVLRLNQADVLALNMAHVLRLNTEICPVFTAIIKEAAFGRLRKGGRPSAPPPPLWFLVCWLCTLGIA